MIDKHQPQTLSTHAVRRQHVLGSQPGAEGNRRLPEYQFNFNERDQDSKRGM